MDFLKDPTEDYDVVWDYTMGFPEDNGFTMTTAYIYTGDNPEMTESGVLYRPPANVYNPYFEFVPTGYTTCNEAIFEADVKILEFNIRNNMKNQLKKEIFENAKIFHLRGGIDYKKLNFVHKTMLKLLFNKVKNLPKDKQTPEDKAMIETYNKKVSFIDFSDLDKIIKEINKER